MQQRRDQFHTLRVPRCFQRGCGFFLEQALRFQRRNDKKAENKASVMENDINDAVILAARLLLAALFLIFGWRKLMDYSGTVSRWCRTARIFWYRLLPSRSSWSFRLRSRSRLERSRVLQPRCWLPTRWELRSLRIA